MRLAAINLFPIKSGRGIALSQAEVEARGLIDDRRWMIVDVNGRFVSQREAPGLARLVAEPSASGLRLALDGSSIEVERPSPGAPRYPVSVWDDTLSLPESAPGSAWVSQVFGQGLRLMYQADDAVRPVEDWAEAGSQVSLADGFPLLIVNSASLDALNRELPRPLGMDRFRPNLVVEGAEPWADDAWDVLRVGAVELAITKPCPRCTLTTVDQALGAFDGEEPLATLRRVRMSADGRVPGLLFGWNAVPRSFGRIRVGDPVQVLATRPRWSLKPPRAVAA